MSNSWQMVPLGEVADRVERPETPLPGKIYRQVGVRLWGEGAYEREPIDGGQTRYQTLSRVESDDIIVNKIWARNGSVAVVPSQLSGCYGSNEFPTFAPIREKLEPRWFHWYTKTKRFWDQCDEKSRGTSGKNRIRPEMFLEIRIPFPPLPEQRRIVARIEELAAKIEEARGLRQQAVKEVKVFFAGAKHEVFSKGPTNSWTVKKLDDAAPINMGQSPPGESYNDIGEGIPLLNGPTEFGDRHPKAAQWTTVPTKLCKRGDILLCVRGATTGRMNWADREYCIGRGLAALTPDPDVCVPEYAYHFVDTQTQEMLALSAGSTFPNLPGEKLKTLPIPLPSVPEQRRIVSYLDSLQAKVDALKQLQAETATELDAMLPSILDKAFKGDL